MPPTNVRKCNCGHYFVGDHGCPSCKAPWLATRLVVRVATRRLARIIAAGLRARPDTEEWYRSRHHKEDLEG